MINTVLKKVLAVGSCHPPMNRYNGLYKTARLNPSRIWWLLLLCLLAATPATAGVKVNFIPIDDGDTNTSEYGYAGDTNDQINAVSFICSALVTVSNQQFIAYYGRHQTDPSYAFNNKIWIGRRTVGSNIWEVFRTTLAPNDINDGHDVVSFGIDGDGYMHVSWGMHGNTFLYTKSTTSVIGTNTIAFGAATTMTGGESNVTYPQFLTMPNGDLLFIFREGTSGSGDTFINRYNHTTQTWINQQGGEPFIKGTGWSPDYNCYPNMPCLDADGNLFFVWTWRYQDDSPTGNVGYQTNHDFDFAESMDGGVTWLRQNGTPYDLPISQSGENGDTNTMGEKVLSIPEGRSLINQAGMCLDANGRPVIATWWGPGGPRSLGFRRQYMVAFPDTNNVWQTRQVSNRTNDPPALQEPESAVRDLGRPVVVADQDNRIIVLYRDNFGSNGLTIVHSLPYAVDPLRTNWTTIDLTTDNLGSYEPVIDLARWQMDNVLHILYQPCTGEGYTAPANTASQIGVLEWDAAAYFHPMPPLQMTFTNANQNVTLSWPSQTGWGYQLQTSTNLTVWDVLTTLKGNEATLQYVHTNAAAVPARFWRLQVLEGGFPP